MVDFFFPTFVAKRQSQKVLKIVQTNGEGKYLMLQNELFRITRSSHSLSTTYLRLLHFGRFTNELSKPCHRLKLPVVIKKLLPKELNHAPDCLHLMIDPGSCFALACVIAREPI